MFAGFVDGRVIFRNGVIAASKLNYNLLNGEMQFIAPTGDTLSIANENTINHIEIGNLTFYYDQMYLQLVKAYPKVKLAARQQLKVVDKQKIGAYGQASPASSIDSYRSFSDGVRTYNLDIREDILLSRQTTYYLGDRFNNFLKANKKNLFNMFSKHEKALDKYLKENAPDFTNQEDLLKLITFLQDL
jgi:hypothetical protein